MKNKYNAGDVVVADGFRCKVIDLGEYEGIWYYTCVLEDGIYFPREFAESDLQKA